MQKNMHAYCHDTGNGYIEQLNLTELYNLNHKVTTMCTYVGI